MLLFFDLADTKVLVSWQNKTATKNSQLVTSRGLLVLSFEDLTLLTFSKLSGDSEDISLLLCCVHANNLDLSAVNLLSPEEEVFYCDVS